MDTINLNHDIEDSLSTDIDIDPCCRTCGDDIPIDIYKLAPRRYLVGRYCLNCGEMAYVIALRASEAEAKMALAEHALKTVFPKLSVDFR